MPDEVADLGLLLTAEEVARLLRCSLSNVRWLTRTGRLPVVRPFGGRHVRYPRRLIEEMLRGRLQPVRE